MVWMGVADEERGVRPDEVEAVGDTAACVSASRSFTFGGRPIVFKNWSRSSLDLLVGSFGLFCPGATGGFTSRSTTLSLIGRSVLGGPAEATDFSAAVGGGGRGIATRFFLGSSWPSPGASPFGTSNLTRFSVRGAGEDGRGVPGAVGGGVGR